MTPGCPCRGCAEEREMASGLRRMARALTHTFALQYLARPRGPYSDFMLLQAARSNLEALVIDPGQPS